MSIKVYSSRRAVRDGFLIDIRDLKAEPISHVTRGVWRRLVDDGPLADVTRLMEVLERARELVKSTGDWLVPLDDYYLARNEEGGWTLMLSSEY